MEDCPVCGSTLEHTDTDSRQEWICEEYYCDTCDNTFSITTSTIPVWDQSKKAIKRMIKEYNARLDKLN